MKLLKAIIISTTILYSTSASANWRLLLVPGICGNADDLAQAIQEEQWTLLNTATILMPDNNKNSTTVTNVWKTNSNDLIVTVTLLKGDDLFVCQVAMGNISK